MSLIRLCTFIIITLACTGGVFAAEFPFTDIVPKDAGYDEVRKLYEQGIISDDGSHLFRPAGLIPRDEFVGIVVGVGCKKCLNPTASDILRYRTAPFLDLTKNSPYFYCVSYAKEKEIIEGYKLDSAGITTCQDGTKHAEVPFCGQNNITRIEAAAVLLRQANYWNKELDASGYAKKLPIADVDQFWYGYAQKAIQVGLIRINSDNQIFPNEYITRREFAQMAAKILSANLCELVDDNGDEHSFAADIKILDKSNTSCSITARNASSSPDETTYDLYGYVPGATADFQYDWTFTNAENGKIVTATGSCLDNTIFSDAGTWVVRLVATEKQTQKTVTAYSQIFRGAEKGGLSLNVEANPLIGNSPLNTQFTSLVSGAGNYSYRWDFGDGAFSTEANPLHTYTSKGLYTVSLTVRDSAGNTGYGTLTIEVRENDDSDGDGVRNTDDLCLETYGPASNQGCPIFATFSTRPTDTSFSKCMSEKVTRTGLISGMATCSSCPCSFTLDYNAELRECDIIFPAILSPDKNTIYSRGEIYEIR